MEDYEIPTDIFAVDDAEANDDDEYEPSFAPEDLLSRHQQLGGEDLPPDLPQQPAEDQDRALLPAEGQDRALLPRQRPLTLKALIRRAHEGLGHPHKERFLKILKYSKANEEVMAAARAFECTACQRNSRVKPARRACPPREIQINEVVGADLIYLTTPDGTTRPALNLIDWHTHFHMVIPMTRKSPEAVRDAYRHWLRFFGPPTTLALDLGREFEGSFALRAESDGTFVDPSSLESPYQRGITERAGKTFKLMLARAMETYVCHDMKEWEELVDIVTMQKNRLLMQNGFSPIQRVIGFNPKIPGGLLSGDAANRSYSEHVRLGDQGVIKAMNMRKAAARAFHETECSQALRRAIESGPRPFQNFEVGETIYFWRVGLGSTRKPAPAYWHGPAKVVMTNPPSTIWVSYQGTLVKASPERIRRASEEEMLTLSGWIDALVETRATLEQEPKRGFLDLTNDPLPPDLPGDAGGDLLPEKDEELQRPRDLRDGDEPHGDQLLGVPRVRPGEDLAGQPREQWQGPLPPVGIRLRGKVRVRGT